MKATLESLGKALDRLEEALGQPLENPLAVDATIQRFEFTIELFWKALKRCLDFEGIDTSTPRDALQQAYQAGWLQDESKWLQMLRDRNATSHTYDEAKAREIYERIRANQPALRVAYEFLRQRFATGI
jgi:nucleotidyltransferase substrate binding protein (TIGR01987 family)